jgi:hypothetical protein
MSNINISERATQDTISKIYRAKNNRGEGSAYGSESDRPDALAEETGATLLGVTSDGVAVYEPSPGSAIIIAIADANGPWAQVISLAEVAAELAI